MSKLAPKKYFLLCWGTCLLMILSTVFRGISCRSKSCSTTITHLEIVGFTDNRPQELDYFKHQILPILEYHTSELVSRSFWRLGCGHNVLIQNITTSISDIATYNWQCGYPQWCLKSWNKEWIDTRLARACKRIHMIKPNRVHKHARFYKRKRKEIFWQSTLNRVIRGPFVQKKDKRGLHSQTTTPDRNGEPYISTFKS